MSSNIYFDEMQADLSLAMQHVNSNADLLRSADVDDHVLIDDVCRQLKKDIAYINRTLSINCWSGQAIRDDVVFCKRELGKIRQRNYDGLFCFIKTAQRFVDVHRVAVYKQVPDIERMMI